MTSQSSPRSRKSTRATSAGASKASTPSAPKASAQPKPSVQPKPAPASPKAPEYTPIPVDLSPTATLARGIGRIPVTKVSPVIEGGAYAAKAVAGELIPVRAKVFREGHDAVNASVVLTSPDGVETVTHMTQVGPAGLDQWEAWVRPDAEGAWTFRVEGWSDPWGTWLHNAEKKLPAGVDIELVCMEGKDLLERTAARADAADDPIEASILRANAMLLIPQRPAEDLLQVCHGAGLDAAMRRYGPRECVSPTAEFPLWVDRKKALFSSWYEFFPRSIGASYDEATDTWTSGTFDQCHTRLEEVAAMGFDVVYFPPIHPVGSAFKKGKNNTLDATDKDPGSPWAIGNATGGHDAINPDLGDWESFDRLVEKANSLGLEIALDFALQASPDHPWVQTHPEWFTTRLDGTIAYAENPPKKYQDIYPINFDNDPQGIYNEVLRIFKLWMAHGIRIFRIDNPHTKPVEFWGWILKQLRQTDPDVIFLAEAFTKPEMMHTLGKVGYHQSYTYFTWRNTKQEITEYMLELSRDMDAFYRPNFFVNTPDINPFFLQSGNPAAFAIRAILAATLSPSWGVYSGFELFEHEPFKIGGEEYLNSEKYEFRPRDFNAQPNLNMLMGSLNAIRHNHQALQQLRRIDFHDAQHDSIIAFSKRDQGDDILVVCSLDPDNTVECNVHVDMGALGRNPGDRLHVRDELTGNEFTWGDTNFVRLTPMAPAHILHIKS